MPPGMMPSMKTLFCMFALDMVSYCVSMPLCFFPYFSRCVSRPWQAVIPQQERDYGEGP